MKVLENTTVEGESPVVENTYPALDSVPKYFYHHHPTVGIGLPLVLVVHIVPNPSSLIVIVLHRALVSASSLCPSTLPPLSFIFNSYRSNQDERVHPLLHPLMLGAQWPRLHRSQSASQRVSTTLMWLCFAQTQLGRNHVLPRHTQIHDEGGELAPDPGLYPYNPTSWEDS
jgi:hypothetical protein